MTNQELLAGFLDRSLSEEELLEFEAQQTASPEFASEVREMLKVEELLTVSTPRVRYPVEFLASVETAVAVKVAAGATAAGLFAVLAHNVWTWVAGGTAAVVIGGGALYLATNKDVESAKPKPSPMSITTAPAVATPAPSIPTSVAETPAMVTRRVSQPHPVTIAPANTTTNSRELLNATVTDPSDGATKQLKAEYEKCKGSNEHVRCAQLALQIGIKLRKDEQGTEARHYLEAAVTHARALKLAEYEMDANGELGLLAKSEGDEQRAASAFRRAVEIGQNNQKNAGRWNSELENLERR
ncbi:MAG: tetratricopeptide repeat protein [Candidatus Kapabacteria bacterium]|nr:tetratricopeptide repeat protein [Candidatus Kapabacteria bacterium]